MSPSLAEQERERDARNMQRAPWKVIYEPHEPETDHECVFPVGSPRYGTIIECRTCHQKWKWHATHRWNSACWQKYYSTGEIRREPPEPKHDPDRTR